ncbi:hypothetical protein EVAR_99208_1 [Eumeta japonica]|uniref:Uncharacterized protein n=1 Tax=Eumeta variegata TaxID=151549 RepID=A0A4C1YTF3_EUMVA|nr:hypothetical protein EVAR_99208_1 [Eumeta japonica]
MDGGDESSNWEMLGSILIAEVNSDEYFTCLGPSVVIASIVTVVSRTEPSAQSYSHLTEFNLIGRSANTAIELRASNPNVASFAVAEAAAPDRRRGPGLLGRFERAPASVLTLIIAAADSHFPTGRRARLRLPTLSADVARLSCWSCLSSLLSERKKTNNTIFAAYTFKVRYFTRIKGTLMRSLRCPSVPPSGWRPGRLNFAADRLAPIMLGFTEGGGVPSVSSLDVSSDPMLGMMASSHCGGAAVERREARRRGAHVRVQGGLRHRLLQVSAGRPPAARDRSAISISSFRGVPNLTLIYGSRNWVWQKKNESGINALVMRSLRNTCGVSLKDRCRKLESGVYSPTHELCRSQLPANDPLRRFSAPRSFLPLPRVSISRYCDAFVTNFTAAEFRPKAQMKYEYSAERTNNSFACVRRVMINSNSHRLRPEDQTGKIVYFGQGLRAGECGVHIRGVEANMNGVLSCILPPQTGSIELTGHMNLTVARECLPQILLSYCPVNFYDSYLKIRFPRMALLSSSGGRVSLNDHRFESPTPGARVIRLTCHVPLYRKVCPCRSSEDDEIVLDLVLTNDASLTTEKTRPIRGS